MIVKIEKYRYFSSVVEESLRIMVLLRLNHFRAGKFSAVIHPNLS